MNAIRAFGLAALALAAAIASPALSQVTPDQRIDAKLALYDRGYDAGDGAEWDQTAIDALMAYQEDWGMEATGALDPGLIAHIKGEGADRGPILAVHAVHAVLAIGAVLSVGACVAMTHI